MNDPFLAIAFYVAAAVTVAAALAVVTLRSIVYSALSLVLTFIGVAAIYVLLHADFVAAVQVLIYVGAVTILLVFAIMLTRSPSSRQSNPDNSQRPVAFIAAVALAVVMAVVFLGTSWPAAASAVPESSVSVVASQIFQTYALPFEIASVLLLAAMVGAIILAREE